MNQPIHRPGARSGRKMQLRVGADAAGEQTARVAEPSTGELR